jgi:hypothetical protein
MIPWQEQAGAAAAVFRQAVGDIESQTDATGVHTPPGWRGLRIAAVLKRPCGGPASPGAWAERVLPAPTARVAWTQISTSDDCARTWRPGATRLGVTGPARIGVSADGADRIRNEARSQFPTAPGVRDVSHAVGHRADAGQRLFGGGSAGADAWREESRQALWSRGRLGVSDQVGPIVSRDGRPETQAVIDARTPYYFKRRDQVGYAGRLAQGRSIGSGLIAGAARSLGKRLKRSGARGDVVTVPGMAT